MTISIKGKAAQCPGTYTRETTARGQQKTQMRVFPEASLGTAPNGNRFLNGNGWWLSSVGRIHYGVVTQGDFQQQKPRSRSYIRCGWVFQIWRQQIKEEYLQAYFYGISNRGKSQSCFNTYFSETTIKKSQKMMMVSVREDSGHFWEVGGGSVGTGQEGHSPISKTWLFS